LEAAGVKFLGPVENDPIFQRVELPAGWKKEPTEHSMWSRLLDERNRARAGIFFKAAFYDRSAHLALTCRYSVAYDYDRGRAENVAVSHVKDGNQVIYSTEPVVLPTDKAEHARRFELEEAASKAAKDWLTARYPDWQNPGAYWDAP
jgi:hypothetical protein